MLSIFCWENGKVHGVKAEDIARFKNKLLWIDGVNITPHETDFLQRTFNLHHLTIEHFSEARHHLKVESFSHYLYCVFESVQKTAPLVMEKFDFVLGKNFLITNHKNNHFQDVKTNPEKLLPLFEKGIDFLQYNLLDNLVDSYFPVLDHLEEELDHLEAEAALFPKKEFGLKILRLKKTISKLRRIVFLQREKISLLAVGNVKFVQEKNYPYYRSLYDHAIKVADFVDNARDEADTTFEIYMSAISNSMNEVMKFLNIIATIALPLTVISGIYGANFLNLPGAEFHSAFWVMIGVMAVLSLMMILNFRRKRWF